MPGSNQRKIPLSNRHLLLFRDYDSRSNYTSKKGESDRLPSCTLLHRPLLLERFSPLPPRKVNAIIWRCCVELCEDIVNRSADPCGWKKLWHSFGNVN